MQTYLSEEKLQYFKEKLLKLKKETESLIDNNNNQPPNESIEELSNYGNHPADIGTEQHEQELETGLNMQHQDRMQHIEEALQRIEDGTYGMSEKSNQPIPEERLEAMPTAKYLVEEEEADNQ